MARDHLISISRPLEARTAAPREILAIMFMKGIDWGGKGVAGVAAMDRTHDFVFIQVDNDTRRKRFRSKFRRQVARVNAHEKRHGSLYS